MKSRIFIGFILLVFTKLLTAQETELLTNPDFTDGTNGWWAYGANISTNNGEVTFDINNAGANPWDIQLGQGELTLKQGYKYTLCWRAKRDNGTLGFNVGLGAAPFTLYFYDNSKDFDGNWQESCNVYTHQDEDVSNVALTVNMGGNAANATFDYIRLVEEPLTPAEKVKITFRVDVQNQAVADKGIFITGSFSNWSAPVQMQANGSIYSVMLELEKGSSIEYKFINGNTYESIDGNCTVGDYKNRVFTVPNSDKSVDLVCFNSCSACTDAAIFNTNPGPGPVSFYGEMQASGNRIIGSRTKQPVQVKGMSFFWTLWGGEKFWTEGAVNSLVDYLNVELIRAPMTVDEEFNNLGGYLHEEWKETQIAYVETLVDAAIARDVYVIIDYHSHHADEHPDNAKEFFRYMAQKYGTYDNVIFEIYNEPIAPDWTTVKSYSETVIETIREYSDNLILVGTESYSSKVYNASLSPIADENVAYVFHFYASYNGSTGFRNDVLGAMANNVAVFASEWGNIYAWGDKSGLTDEISFADSEGWHKLLDDYAISSANWCVLSTNMSLDSPNEAAIFNNEFGSISRTGEYWNDVSRLTPSGLYMYNMLNKQAEKVQWRKAQFTNTVDVTFTVNMQDEIISNDGVFIHVKNYNNESEVEMTANGSAYSATLSLPVGSFIKYRFKNGNEAEVSNSQECISWDEYRSIIVPDTDYAIETVCFNSCSNCLEIESYTINTASSPPEGGAVTQGGSYEDGTVITLEASQNADYKFVNWTENGIVVSINPNHSFTVNSDRTLVANFELKTYSVSTNINPSNSGTVTGARDYDTGSTANLTATAATGYDFVNWTENGIEVSINPNYSFTVNSDRTLVANFELKTYSVSTNINPSNSGTVTGARDYDAGSTAVLTATAATGYDFVNWTENGTEISTNPEFIFTVTSNRTVVANFDNTVGVFDQIDDLDIHIYPNPTNGKVTIEGKNIEIIEVFNIYGEIVKTIKISSDKTNIHLGKLSKGTYVLKLTTDDTISTTKILLN